MEPERTETDSTEFFDSKELKEKVTHLEIIKLNLEKTISNLEKDSRGLTMHRDRLLSENRRYAEFFDSFAEIFKVSSAFTGVTDEMRQEIEDNIDIEDRVKSIISDNLSVSINDATVNASLEVDI